eukprot:IDg2680t1
MEEVEREARVFAAGVIGEIRARQILKERKKGESPKGAQLWRKPERGGRGSKGRSEFLEVRYQLGFWVWTIYAVEDGVREHSKALGVE